jgi:hypothetical protein
VIRRWVTACRRSSGCWRRACTWSIVWISAPVPLICAGMRAAKMRTGPLRQCFGRKQAIGFNDGSLAMHPLRLGGTPPGAFRWESKGQDAHAFARLFDLLSRGTQWPSQAAKLAQAIKWSRAFFSQVLRVGAGNPILGLLPVGFQPFESTAHALVGNRYCNNALLQTHLGNQFQGPGATFFAEVRAGGDARVLASAPALPP